MISSKYLLYINLLLDSICWSILIPSLPGMNNSLGLSTLSVGSITSLVSMLTFFTGIVQGRIADSIGRFKMLRLSLCTQLVGHLLILVALRWRSSLLFTVARCIPALCKCGMVVSQAVLHDISSPSENVSNLATLLAFSNIAYIIGPCLGGVLYAYNELLVSRLACLICVGSILLLYTTEWAMAREFGYQDTAHPHEEATDEPSEHVKPFSTTTSLYHLLHVKFAFQLGNTLFEAFLPQHSTAMLRLTSTSIGLILAWSGILSALTNLFVLKQLDMHSMGNWLTPLVIGLCSGLALWAISTSMWPLLLAVSVITVASNMFLGILQGMIALASPSARGKGLSHLRSEGDLRALDLHRTTSLYTVTAPSIEEGIPPPPMSNKLARSGSGAVYGLSSTADRAARIVSPLLGGLLLERFGPVGLVGMAIGVLCYCLALLHASAVMQMDVQEVLVTMRVWMEELVDGPRKKAD